MIQDENWETAVLEGSSRSSKTYSIIQYLIIKSLNEPGITVRAFREDGTTCNKTIVNDFKDIMRNQFGIWKGDNWNKQEKHYVFDNGSHFYFDGTQDISKLHGLTQDYAWLNEVMEIRHDAWTQIEIRTKRRAIMDFNPSITNHWVFSTVLTREKNILYNHSTYQDNPFLGDRQIAAIEALEPTPKNIRQGTANEWKWRVYGLGERAGREGRVYTNYRQTEFFPDPYLCRKYGYGLDFGFSGDPAALVECALFQNELYLRIPVYEKGLLTTKSPSKPSIPSLQGRFEEHGVKKHVQIIADSAKPESIAELSALGYNIVPCKKGPDSILNGINILQGLTMVVDRRSTELLQELENYTWKKDKSTDQWLDMPIDEYNHALDAVRYWGMRNLNAARVNSEMDMSKMPRQAIMSDPILF